MSLDSNGLVLFNIVSNRDANNVTLLSPEAIGAHIIGALRHTAETHFSRGVSKAVISVPAEFELQQRNATRRAAQLAGPCHSSHLKCICSSVYFSNNIGNAFGRHRRLARHQRADSGRACVRLAQEGERE